MGDDQGLPRVRRRGATAERLIDAPVLSGARPVLSGARPVLSGARPVLSRARPVLSGARPVRQDRRSCASWWSGPESSA
jgi:hypothetical protein